ncbi:hypothetical protein Trydic_g13592 [Trypoxylus dichotomus]
MYHASALKKAVDIKSSLEKFTIDVIGSCAFGINCNGFETPNSDFRRYGEKIFHSPFKMFKVGLGMSYKVLAKRVGLTTIGKDSDDFFCNLAMDRYNYRVRNGIKRKDFMQILIELSKTATL